jgi:threonine dehydrogenase-like Zn-dependent dehydrogenase
MNATATSACPITGGMSSLVYGVGAIGIAVYSALRPYFMHPVVVAIPAWLFA